jgi:hypothetical protein
MIRKTSGMQGAQQICISLLFSQFGMAILPGRSMPYKGRKKQKREALKRLP